MEKILLVINAQKINMAAVDFACTMAALTQSKLTGLFVENLYYHDASLPGHDASYFSITEQKNDDTIVSTDIDQAVTHFVRECSLKNIASETVVITGEPIQGVLFESRFADLLIVSPNTNFYNQEEEMPSHFSKELLHQAECPVVLAPDEATAINEIVFCYDGSASSVYAIKQFTYLFAGMASKKLSVLEANKNGKDEFSDAHRRLMGWLKAHYQTVTYQSLAGDPKEALFTYFIRKEGKLVVMGSYGRSLLSRWFKPSTANCLIRTVDLPLFITHFNQ